MKDQLTLNSLAFPILTSQMTQLKIGVKSIDADVSKLYYFKKYFEIQGFD